MIYVYVELIRKGIKTFADVPESLQDEVKAMYEKIAGQFQSDTSK